MFLTCDEHLGVICFREGHRVEARIGCDLPRGEADGAHGHSEGLAATPRSAEQGLFGHFAEGSDDRHVVSTGEKDRKSYKFNHMLKN